jgi:hypothetical protein
LLTRRSASVNSSIDSIYLKFYIFHPQICFVVNRRGTPGHLWGRLQVHSMQR